MSDARAEPPTRRRWYLHADSDVYGPYDQATITGMIARKQVLRDDKVHVEGGSEWLNAELDPTLGPIFPKQPVPVAKPSAQKGKLTDWMKFIPIDLGPGISSKNG